MTTYNITGVLSDALDVPLQNATVTFTPHATSDAQVVGANVRLGSRVYAANAIPNPIVIDAGYWDVTIASTAIRRPTVGPLGLAGRTPSFGTISTTINLTANTTWGAIVSGAVTDYPFTPSLLAQAAADATNAAASAASASASASALSGLVTPDQFGTCPGDDTDVSAYVNAAIASSQTSGGYVGLLPGKRYTMTSALVFPRTGGPANPVQKPVRITSLGASSSNGRWIANPLNGGATLDLRYAGAGSTSPAKIDTRGAGMLEIDHVNLISGGTDDYPIFQTTNTAVHVHHCFIQGNTGKTGTACKQDAFVLGGISVTIDDTDDAPFQGYGSKIHDNFFDHIRRGGWGRAYCNSVSFENNTFSTTCGNDGTGGGTIASGTANLGAAIEFTGNPTAGYCVGNTTRGNTIEVPNYKYGIAAAWATRNTFGPDGIWDPSTGYVAAVYFDPTAVSNVVTEGYSDDNFPIVLDSALDNKVLTTAQSRFSFASELSMVRAANSSQTFNYNGSDSTITLANSGDGAAIGVVPTNPGGFFPECTVVTITGETVTDLVTVAGSDVVTSATAAWTRQSQYSVIKQTGTIPANSFIIRYISPTSVQISSPATASGTGLTCQFGLGIGRSVTRRVEMGFKNQHLISKGAIGSPAVYAPAGAGATITVSGTDTAFTLTLTTGTATATGNVCVVGAQNSWFTPPHVQLTARNQAAALAMAGGKFYVSDASSTGTNTFFASGVALPASTVLIFDVFQVS